MDAVTYPNVKVIELLQSNLIPLQIRSNAQPQATSYNVKWTPNLLILDSDGKEHHRIIGFLPPVELMGSSLLGIGKAHFDKDQLNEAISSFDRVLAEFAYTGAAPEAVYFRGVSMYKSTHQSQHLREAYLKLQSEYHLSEWAKRAYPYWVL